MEWVERAKAMIGRRTLLPGPEVLTSLSMLQQQRGCEGPTAALPFVGLPVLAQQDFQAGLHCCHWKPVTARSAGAVQRAAHLGTLVGLQHLDPRCCGV